MGRYFKEIKNDFKLKHLTNYLLVLGILAVGVVMLLTGSLRLSVATLFTQIGFSIILAVSLNLVVGFLGELSLGHAGFMCVGAYIGGLFALKISEVIPSKLAVLLLSMLVGGLVATFFGFIIGLPSLRLKGDYLAIVTLAFGEIVRNVFKNQKVFGGAMGLNTSSIKYDTRKAPLLFIVTFIVAFLMILLVQNLIRSKHGRAVTAIRDNEIAAKSMGINVAFYKLFIFMLSAFFAGVAGVIYSHYASPVIYTFFSYNYSIEILVMVVLGGMGSITGSIVSAVLIPVINYVLMSNVPPEFAAIRYLIYALVLIFIIIFGNAPALKNFREKYSPKALITGRRTSSVNPAKRTDDEAVWHRIPSKIKMDALLSTDLTTDYKHNGPTDDTQSGGNEK